MNNFAAAISRSGVVTRITALWAFSEAFLGGILHGFKVPFAGLALSLVAAICMTLIAVNDATKAAVLKATLVVLAVKFILSPHTPPMAYVAVLIEGLAGELLLFRRRNIRSGAFILTVFCLLYSAFQHLLILTIVFGKGFWNALDIFLNGITKTFIATSQHYSLYLVLFYTGCYFIAGIAGGVFCVRLIKKIQSGEKPGIVHEFANSAFTAEVAAAPAKKHFSGKQFFALLLLVLLIISYTPLLKGTFFSKGAAQVLLRGILILLVWNFLLSPLLIKAIASWVQRYQKKQNNRLQEILALFPMVRNIVFFSWQKSANAGRFKKIGQFLSNTIMLIVYG